MILKNLAFILLILIFISAYIISFNEYLLYGFSTYGCIIIFYFFIQLISSYLNHKRNTKLKDENWLEKNKKRIFYDCENNLVMEEPFICVLIMVGHKERKDYWSKALKSLIKLSRENLKKIYIIIDGNEEEDTYMMQMAKEEMSESEIEYNIISINHRGKRGAIFFGFEQIRKDYPNQENNIDVVLSDSDTELYPLSILRLQECLRSDPENGCATGVLLIYNKKDGVLPRMIHARYIYAFMIERGASSYHGCMTCCSGPLSIYRLKVLNELITQKFVTQKFLTVKCEPGDDRHLTNLVLAQGYKARQTNYSLAGTEAPETWIRFLNQQLRWSRSFYRESYWQIKAIPRQSYYLSFLTVYELLFPFFLTTWFIKILYLNNNYIYLLQGFIITLIVLMIKTMILYFYLFDNNVWYNILYFPCYLFLLLPTKIFGFMTILDNGWVSQPRFNKTYINCSYHILFLSLWNIFLWSGLIRHVLIFYKNQ